jgi:hypothetical protein
LAFEEPRCDQFRHLYRPNYQRKSADHRNYPRYEIIQQSESGLVLSDVEGWSALKDTQDKNFRVGEGLDVLRIR